MEVIPCFNNHSNYLWFCDLLSVFLLINQTERITVKILRAVYCLQFYVLQLISLFKGPSFCNMLKSKTVLREASKGYIPRCDGDNGNFSPVQCSQDQESCWCVFDNGEEVPGTRVRDGRPSCASEFLLEMHCLSANAGLKYSPDFNSF